ncbi:MAG: hypothetical protein ACOYMG_06980 [Candidatus Methylumidiphilus sp.]
MPNPFKWIASLFKNTSPVADSGAAKSRNGWKLPLSDAVRDATTLLAFAGHSGITLTPEQMNPILEIGKALANDDGTLVVDVEKEQAFWGAYSSVVAKISPVTSASINATLENRAGQPASLWRKQTIAQKTVLTYGFCSLLVLVSIIYFQSYMQMGMTIRENLLTSFNSQKQAIDELFTAKIAKEDSRLKAAGQEGQENYVRKLHEKYIFELKSAQLRASQDELNSWDKGGGRVLTGLGMTSGVIKGNTTQDTPTWLSLTTGQSASKASDLPLASPGQPKEGQPDPLMLGKSAQIQSGVEINPQSMASANRDNFMILAELKNAVIPTYLALNESERILRLISEFILPLLYGLLGSCAYVLRDLTNTIGAVTFSKSTLINYNLRLIMGPLVGIAVGLFLGVSPPDLFQDTNSGTSPVSPANNTNITSLSTVALAFLAGYSVEVLFSALDTLVGAFARKTPPKSKGNKEVTPG